MKVSRVITVGIICFMTCVVLLGCASQQWQDFKMVLPEDTGELVLRVRPMHPFLAEYEYLIDVHRTDGRTFHAELAKQTGGTAHLQVIWYPPHGAKGPFLQFRHMISGIQVSELFDTADGTIISNIEEPSEFSKLLNTISQKQSIELGYLDKYLAFHHIYSNQSKGLEKHKPVQEHN